MVHISVIILSHLLEDLAIGLQFIFFAEHLSGTKTVSLRKLFNCILKLFIQSPHSIMELWNKPVQAVDGPVRPCWIPGNLTSKTQQEQKVASWKGKFSVGANETFQYSLPLSSENILAPIKKNKNKNYT